MIMGTTDTEHAGALFMEFLPRHVGQDTPNLLGEFTRDEMKVNSPLLIIYSTRSLSNGAHGLNSYGDMIIIQTYIHAHFQTPMA